MTADKVDEYARKRELLPESTTLSEYMLYHCLVKLYWEYSNGVTDAKTCKCEKSHMIKRFETQSRAEAIDAEITRRMVEIGKLAAVAHKDGCTTCERLIEIFDGRRRYAENLEE